MKIVRPLKLLCIIAGLLLICGCKKYSKELTTVNFHLFNPVTNEPYVGVTVKIIQDEDVTPAFRLENEYESTVIWEGKTDANGKASASFKVYKKDKFTYWHYVDQQFLNTHSVVQQPDYGPIVKDGQNVYIYTAIKFVNSITWLKNINCVDSEDKCRMRRRSILSEGENWSDWIPAIIGSTPEGYFEGCYDVMTPLASIKQDIVDIELEVIRNGIQETIRDTFYITGHGGIDTTKIFY